MKLRGRVQASDSARSLLMRRVRQKDTTLERSVRALLASVGARYRMNVAGLPGRPDVANKARRKAVFVHGCFWHFCTACPRGRIPKTNRAFWQAKLVQNRLRDERKVAELRGLGFDVKVVWECEMGRPLELTRELEEFWHR